jgi:arylformamidase
MVATRRFIDLSHDIISGQPGYPGLPVPRVEPWKTHAASRSDYDGQAEFQITRLFLVGNTGTSIDSPYHRFPRGADIADLALERIAAVPARRVAADVSADRSIRLAGPIDEMAGMGLLLRTGWDARLGTDAYWHGAPFVGRSLARRLVDAGIAIVGIDGPNIDDTTDPTRPAHTLLLDAGIPIVEHLRGLDGLPDTGFRFFAVPAPIRGASASPVRAFAVLDGSF